MGSRRQPTSVTNKTPTAAHASPTGAKSNMLKLSPSELWRNSAMMMLGGVPISVIMPPSIDAKDKGISVSEGLRFAFAAAWMSTGINMARAATLFITADSAAAIPAITAICVCSDTAKRLTCLAISSIAPEFDRPLLTINTNAMMIVAGWPNPEKASCVGTTPIISAAIKATKATRS